MGAVYCVISDLVSHVGCRKFCLFTSDPHPESWTIAECVSGFSNRDTE